VCRDSRGFWRATGTGSRTHPALRECAVVECRKRGPSACLNSRLAPLTTVQTLTYATTGNLHVSQFRYRTKTFNRLCRKHNRGLTLILRALLHWLHAADLITYTLCITVRKCLHSQAPDYMSELSLPVAQVAERHHLRRFGQPPPSRRAADSTRHVRPSCFCHGWSDRLELTLQRSSRSRSQHRQLRSPVSAVFSALSALEALCDNALYKLPSPGTNYSQTSCLKKVSTVLKKQLSKRQLIFL